MVIVKKYVAKKFEMRIILEEALEIVALCTIPLSLFVPYCQLRKFSELHSVGVKIRFGRDFFAWNPIVPSLLNK